MCEKPSPFCRVKINVCVGKFVCFFVEIISINCIDWFRYVSRHVRSDCIIVSVSYVTLVEVN